MVQMIVYNIKETACVSLLAILSQPTRCHGLVVRISAFDSDGPGSNPGGTFLFLLFVIVVISYYYFIIWILFYLCCSWIPNLIGVIK